MFDALEIDCCASEECANGTPWTEQTRLHEAQFFTIFGHLKEGGCEAITDVSTRKLAHRIALIFQEKIESSCRIFDCCDSIDGCIEANRQAN